MFHFDGYGLRSAELVSWFVLMIRIYIRGRRAYLHPEVAYTHRQALRDCRPHCSSADRRNGASRVAQGTSIRQLLLESMVRGGILPSGVVVELEAQLGLMEREANTVHEIHSVGPISVWI